MGKGLAPAEPLSRRPRLSVAIIARDEEANLRITLPTLGFADEIVLVDSGSTDATIAVAEQYNARVVQLPWQGFGAQKNAALDATTGEWILSLDADEAVPAGLASEILQAIEHPSPAAYFLPRLNYFLGQPMRHGGLFPDPKLRLARRGAARWHERPVHETMFVVSPGTPAGRLRTALEHHAYPTLGTYLEHLGRYSSLAAPVLAARGRTSAGRLAFLLRIVANPGATFLYNYVLRLGFLDGRRGLLYHLFYAFAAAQKYALAWELARRRELK